MYETAVLCTYKIVRVLYGLIKPITIKLITMMMGRLINVAYFQFELVNSTIGLVNLLIMLMDEAFHVLSIRIYGIGLRKINDFHCVINTM